MKSAKDIKEQVEEMNSNIKSSNSNLQDVSDLLDEAINQQYRFNNLIDVVDYKLSELKRMGGGIGCS